MKKSVFICIFSLLTVAIYTQDWTIDGYINLDFYEWGNSFSSENLNDFSLSLKVGRYVTDILNIGLRVGFGSGNTGTNFTVGPYLKFDLYEFENVCFDITEWVYYTKYNGSYSWNNDYFENDANRIFVGLAPSITYMVNKNIEVYWQFAVLSYRYDWLTLKGTTTECKVNEFRITGPFRDPTFGIRFRF